MKQKIRSLSIIALIAACTIVFTACCRECSHCTVRAPDLTEQVTFNLPNKSMQKEFMIYQMSMSSGYYREYLGQTKFDESFFDFFKEYCLSKNIPVNEQTMKIVLYYNSPITKTFKVSDENIQGISVFGVEKKKIMHHLFVKNEKSEFYEEENTKVAVRYVTHNHIHFYLENYVFSDPQNKSYIIISGNFAMDVQKNRKKYYRGPFLRFEIKPSAKAQQHPSGGYYTCDSPYPLEQGGCFTQTDNFSGEIHYCETEPFSDREDKYLLSCSRF